MIELLAGILIGATVVTGLWIRNLEHIRDRNRKTFQDLLEKTNL